MRATRQDDFWLGRVFTAGVRGGNHTALVAAGDVAEPTFAEIARLLDVPDTGFLLDRRSVRADPAGADVLLRTFSPHEELQECLQTSLAVPVALQDPPGLERVVRHRSGAAYSVHREDDRVWARLAAHEPTTRRASDIDLPVDAADVVVVGSARPRVLGWLADEAALLAVDPSPAAVVRMCRGSGTHGLVLVAQTDTDRYRIRVFTTSLRGAEDRATGGAVLALGTLQQAGGRRGECVVTQGPSSDEELGHFVLRLGVEDVLLGAEVRSLSTGRTATS